MNLYHRMKIQIKNTDPQNYFLLTAKQILNFLI